MQKEANLKELLKQKYELEAKREKMCKDFNKALQDIDDKIANIQTEINTAIID